MNNLKSVLSAFEPISLDQLKSIGLMARFDTKFVFHIQKLPGVLEALAGDYRLLTADRTRVFSYRTVYFDTDNFYYYSQHHDQRVNRYKFRYRSYLETGQSYFEVKLKTNKKKTIKNRILLGHPVPEDTLTDESRMFAKECLTNENRHHIDQLRPALSVGYRRITLANTVSHERITFDLGLNFSDGKRSMSLDHLVVAELKQSQSSVKSEFFHLLKTRGIQPVKFSKYCMGVVLMKKSGKTNRFKKKVLLINKLADTALR